MKRIMLTVFAAALSMALLAQATPQTGSAGQDKPKTEQQQTKSTTHKCNKKCSTKKPADSNKQDTTKSNTTQPAPGNATTK